MSTATRLRRAVQSRPLSSFFVLCCLLSWALVPVTGGSLLPHGVTIAALIVLRITRNQSGTPPKLGMSRWRVGWKWYLIGPGIITSYLVVALLIVLALGVEVTNTEALSWTVIAGLVAELAFFGGQWEEPGWTGYAFPSLQARLVSRRCGLLQASLILAGMRAIWHMPLVIYGHIPWFDAIFLSLALQFIITWIYNRTEGSTPVVMLTHLTSNVVGGGIVVKLFSGSDQTLYYVTFIGVALVVATVLNARGRWSMGVRRQVEHQVTVR